MVTKITIEIDTATGYCSIVELNAEPICTQIDTSSSESLAHDAGRALEEYLEGFGGKK